MKKILISIFLLVILLCFMFYVGYDYKAKECKSEQLDRWVYGTWGKSGTFYDMQNTYIKKDSMMIGGNYVRMVLDYNKNRIKWSLEKVMK